MLRRVSCAQTGRFFDVRNRCARIQIANCACAFFELCALLAIKAFPLRVQQCLALSRHSDSSLLFARAKRGACLTSRFKQAIKGDQMCWRLEACLERSSILTFALCAFARSKCVHIESRTRVHSDCRWHISEVSDGGKCPLCTLPDGRPQNVKYAKVVIGPFLPAHT